MSIAVHDDFKIEALATRLAESVGKERRERQDPFHTPLIFVPNLNVQTWLCLQIARWDSGRPEHAPSVSNVSASVQIAINLEVKFFEAGLWDALAELDRPEDGAKPLSVRVRLTREVLQWMIVATLMAEPAESPLKPLLDYAGAERDPNDRQYARKVWQVADKLARLFREYEFHRPEMIHAWLSNKNPGQDLFGDESAMFVCQRELYRGLFGPGGLRDSISASDENKRGYYSLPQVAELLLEGKDRKKLKWERLQRRGVIRFFIPPQLSATYRKMLQQLGEHLDLEIYHLATASAPAKCALNEQWGRAGRIKADWLRELRPKQSGKPAKVSAAAATVLGKLQQDLLGFTNERGAKAKPEKLAQDCSVQIAGCPSIRREVETVCNSVIHKMVTDPELSLSDIAILVPDMAAYKPALESVLNRHPRMLPYNLVDATAADDSVFAQAVTALLKLAEGDFVRREVFELILNPCFLSAHGMTRDDALVWLQWANKLNIFRKFKTPDGAQTAPFSWQNGLRRLRLGRLMEAPDDAAGEALFYDYRKVVPFADMESGSPQEAGRFSLAIETLADAAGKLGAEARGIGEWNDILRHAFDSILAIPQDRMEEQWVQSTLSQALNEFRLFDLLVAKTFERSKQTPPNGAAGLPLIQEFVRDNLASVPSRVGHYLLDGVTIGALKPERPLPFKVVYVLGLGEGQFPGSEPENALDVGAQNSSASTEVSASDAAKQCFLETVLSARGQLYLTFVSRNLQKDETFQPCSVLSELRTYLAENVLASREFEVEHIPLRGASERYLLESGGSAAPWNDLLARNYWPADNLAAFSDLLASLDTRKDLGEPTRKALKKYRPRIEKALKKMAFAPGKNPQAKNTADIAGNRVTLYELEKFLLNPVEASLRRHLKLFDDTEEDWALAEDEPFSTHFPFNYELLSGVMKQLVRNCGAPGKKGNMEASALESLRGTYAHAALCGGVPPGAFGELDKANFSAKIKAALSPDMKGVKGAPCLIDFLSSANRTFFGGVVIGATRAGETHALTFPPLALTIAKGAATISLHGDFPFIWENGTDGCRELLVLAPMSKRKDKCRLSKHAVAPYLFYLALQAGSEANAGGVSSAQWWGERSLRVCVCYSDGLQAWNYGRVSPADAKKYLEMLAGELISNQTCDLLPFETVCGHKPEPGEVENARPDPDEYARELQEKIDADSESGYLSYRAPEYLELAKPRVPLDALDKVVRRICPLFKAIPVECGDE